MNLIDRNIADTDTNKLKDLLKGVVWDYNISETDLLEIFLHDKKGQALNADQLKARLLNTYNWYFLIDFFGKDVAKKFLNDRITAYLFPKALRDKYVRAGRILYS